MRRLQHCLTTMLTKVKNCHLSSVNRCAVMPCSASDWEFILSQFDSASVVLKYAATGVENYMCLRMRSKAGTTLQTVCI